MSPYISNLKDNLWSFMVSRLFPFFGVSIAAALLAHKNIEDLPVFAYVLAVFSVVATVFSMPLAAIGNIFHNKSTSLSAQEIFGDGFKIAIVFSFLSLVTALAVLFFISHVDIKGIDKSELKFLSIVYLFSVPLLVINTYLHIFHEATDGASVCAKIKKRSILSGCFLLVSSFFVADHSIFLYFAMGYFPVVEVFLLVSLIFLSKKRGYILFKKQKLKIFRDVLILGFPIAAGLAGQKLYYYLLNERLISIKSSLAGDLSICMSVIGCLTIPLIAFSQMHSVYTSRNRFSEDGLHLQGLKSCTGLLFLTAIFLGFGGKPLFYIFGDNSLEFNGTAFLVILFSIATSGYFMTTTSHLRGMNDTLTPQITINIVMLAGLIPIIYLSDLGNGSVYTFITLQSVAVLAVTVLLQYRICVLNKNITKDLYQENY